MKDLITMGAQEARSQIVAGKVRASELIQACLARIKNRDSEVGAWAHINPEYALHEAILRDESFDKGHHPGLLHGIPIGIKDIIDTQDYPTEYGCEVFKGRKPNKDAQIVHRLKSEGAIIMGKTVTCELAFYSPGKTRNPLDLERTPGGSSSGSAAAVADFHLPLAIGTQTAGSVLRPASYCGVIGFKPSYGQIPLEGILEQSPPLDTLGCFARSIEDVRLLMSVLMGKKFSSNTFKKSSVRLAFVRTRCWDQGDKGMQHVFNLLLHKYSSCIEEVGIPNTFSQILHLQKCTQFHDIARNYGPIADNNQDAVSQKLREVIEQGRTIDDAEYKKACAKRETMYSALCSILNVFDAIITPAATGIAPRGLSSTGSPIFNFLWTYLGCPAITLPLLTLESMPLGVQLVGARGSDERLLEIAEKVKASLFL